MKSTTEPLSPNYKYFRKLVRETNLANVAVLFVECFSLDSGKIDLFIQIATIKMRLSIICFKGSQLYFPDKCVLQSLNIAFIIANSADPDEMQQTTKIPFQGFPVYKVFILHYQMFIC